MTRLRALLVAVVAACTAVPATAQMSEPSVLVVNSKSGVKTLADFIAWGKRSNKPLAYSSAGLDSREHRLTESFAQKLGIKVVHVPYRAASQGLLDLMGGHIDFSMLPVALVVGQVRGGLLSAVAVAASEREPDFPDVPTFAESGYPEFVGTTRANREIALIGK